MISSTEREATLAPILRGRSFLPILACAVLLALAAAPFPARAVVSLTEMARLEASDAITHDNTLALFRG